MAAGPEARTGRRRWPGFRSQLLLALLSSACASSAPVDRPARGAPAPPTTREAPTAAPAEEEGLYSPDEALRDVLSSELEFVGKGSWVGIERYWACVFRNDRVLVVNVYCTVSDSHTFRVDVLSPTRGYVRIYAEATGPISIRDRALYFTFTAASQPPPGPTTGIPPLALTMSYEELRDYDRRRYDAFLPGCYGGEQHEQPVGGCLGALADRRVEWASQSRAFLDQASGDWYRVLRALRALAVRHGRDP